MPQNTIHYTRPYSHVRYRQLCQQTQTSKGFKVGTILDGGFFGDQRKNCYYLCDADATAVISDSVANPKPFFHCCPPGYSMDFDKQLCADNDSVRRRRSQHAIKGGGRKGFHLSRQYINYVEGVRKEAAQKPAVLVTKKLPGKRIRVSEPTIKDVGKCESEYKKHSLCNKYWQCVAGRFEVEMTCPSGLYWNELATFCDINRNVECAKDLPSLNDLLDKRDDFHWPQTNATLSYPNRTPSFKIPSFKKTNNKVTRIRMGTQSTKGGRNPSKGERKEATKSASSSSSSTATKTTTSSSTLGWSVKGKWFKTISSNNKSTRNNGSIIPAGVRCLNKWQASFYKRRYGIDCSINHVSVTGFRKQFGVRRRFWKNSTKGASGTKTDDGTKNKPISGSTQSPVQTTTTMTTSTAATSSPTTTITSTEPEASTTANPEANSSESPPTEQVSTPTSAPSTPSTTAEPTTQLTTNQSTTGEPTSEPTSEPSTTITSTTSQSTATTDGESGNKTEEPVIDTSTPISTTTNGSSTETTPTITESSQSTTVQPTTTTTTSTTTTESPPETTPTPTTKEPVVSSTEESATIPTTTTTTESTTVTSESSSTTESPAQPTTEPVPETVSTTAPPTGQTSPSTVTETVTPITPTIATSSTPITLTSTVANNATIETTTPLFDGTVKENGPCLHPSQRFKDEDDCQCFYECQFNRKLIRNCCPEGLLFNQNESIPDNNDESESDDSVCDLPENVQCTSIIS